MLELSHIWFRSTDDLSLQSRVYSPERQAPSSVALANTPQQKELHLTSTSKKATVARRAATQQYEQASVDLDHLTASHTFCAWTRFNLPERDLLRLRDLNSVQLELCRVSSCGSKFGPASRWCSCSCTSLCQCQLGSCQPKDARVAGLGCDYSQQTNGWEIYRYPAAT